MEQYVAAMNVPLCGNTFKPAMVNAYYITVGYFYLVLPVITIIFWGVCLLMSGLKAGTVSSEDFTALLPGISVLAVGLAIFLFLYSVIQVRYNNWRFKTVNLVTLIISYLLFFGWIVTLLISSRNEYFTFYAASAVFMTQNGIVATVGLTLNMHSNKFNLVYFIEKFMKNNPN